jgi:hypothetical protein
MPSSQRKRQKSSDRKTKRRARPPCLSAEAKSRALGSAMRSCQESEQHTNIAIHSASTILDAESLDYNPVRSNSAWTFYDRTASKQRFDGAGQALAGNRQHVRETSAQAETSSFSFATYASSHRNLMPDCPLTTQGSVPRRVANSPFLTTALWYVGVFLASLSTAHAWGTSGTSEVAAYGNMLDREWLYSSTAMSIKFEGCLWGFAADSDNAGCMESGSSDGTTYWYQMANCRRAQAVFSVFSTDSGSSVGCNKNTFKESVCPLLCCVSFFFRVLSPITN